MCFVDGSYRIYIADVLLMIENIYYVGSFGPPSGVSYGDFCPRVSQGSQYDYIGLSRQYLLQMVCV